MNVEYPTGGNDPVTLIIKQVSLKQLEYIVNRFLVFGLVSMDYNDQLQVSVIRMITGRLADHVENILGENGYLVERIPTGNIMETGWQQLALAASSTNTTSMSNNTNGLNISRQKPNSNQKPVNEMNPSTEENFTTTLDKEWTIFLSQITLSIQGFDERMQFLGELEEILYFGKIHPFGSFINGLAGPESDVDIYFEDYRRGMTKKQTINRVADSLRYAVRHDDGSKLGNMVVVLPNIRVPLIRFVHGATNIQCDISFENIMSVQNSKLIKFLLSLHPIARPLTLFLCHWARSHGLVCQNGLKTYAIALLSIVFLMRKNMLPSVEFLQSLCPPYIINDGWNVAFCDDERIVRTEMRRRRIGDPPDAHLKPLNILTFVNDFFDMVKSLRSSNCYVSTQTGNFISIYSSSGCPFRAWMHNLPKIPKS